MTRADLVALCRARAHPRWRRGEPVALRALSISVIALAVLPVRSHLPSTRLGRSPRRGRRAQRLSHRRLPLARAEDAQGRARHLGRRSRASVARQEPRSSSTSFRARQSPTTCPHRTVWRDPTHMSMEGAHWLPNVGYGVLSPAFEELLPDAACNAHRRRSRRSPSSSSARRTAGCPGTRPSARSSGATRACIWFSEGTDAWQEAGLDLVRVEPVP